LSIRKEIKLSEIKGIDKLVQRMEKARHEAQYKKIMAERRSNSPKKTDFLKLEAARLKPLDLSVTRSPATCFGKVDGSKVSVPERD